MLIYDISNPAISASNPTKIAGFATSGAYANCWKQYNASNCFIGVTPDNASSIPHLLDILNNTKYNLLENDPLSFLFGASVNYQLYSDRDALQKAYLSSEGRMWSGK